MPYKADGRLLVYLLVDPRNSEARYVGKSTRGLNRPRDHSKPYELRKRCWKNHWLRPIIEAGLRPRIEVLQECEDKASLALAEVHWIAVFRQMGARLTNGTKGGEGHDAPHTVDGKRNISASKGGRPFVDEVGNVFFTHAEAADHHGIAPQSVYKVLCGRLIATHGHSFCYQDRSSSGRATPRQRRWRSYTPEQLEALATRNRARSGALANPLKHRGRRQLAAAAGLVGEVASRLAAAGVSEGGVGSLVVEAVEEHPGSAPRPRRRVG